MSSKSEDLLKTLEKNIPVEVQKKNIVAQKESSPAAVMETTADVKDDYEFSREKYRELVEKGMTAIDSMTELALQSDHPRAYEVLGGMMKSVSDMTDKLMSLHKNVDSLNTQKGKQQPQQSAGGTVTNNNVFVGSTTDLQRMIIAQQAKAATIIDNE